MKVIRPIAVTGATLVASSVPETDHTEWAAGTNYALGARVISASTHRVYESTIAGNIGHDPATGATQWLDVGPTNRWAMFAPEAGPRTASVTAIEVTLAPASAVDVLGLVDVEAATVRVRVLNGAAVEYDHTVDVAGANVATFDDLPAFAGQTIIVTAAPTGGQAAIGKLVFGAALALGNTQAGPTVGITDYSRRETDDFGVTTVVERSWAKRISIRSRLDSTMVDQVQRQLADLRATPTLWIGENGFDALTAYGTFKDFSVELQIGAGSFCSLTIEGLPSVAGILPVLDPAPDGDSDLHVLRPVTIAEAALTYSSVAENDHPQWLAGTSYALGAKSIRQHRIYESLVADNVGHDPAISGGKWLDIGPTNRWAMFDRALGTVTSAVGQIVVMILVDGPVTGLAVLDVDGASVRVQAPGYDETQIIASGGLPTVPFLDLDLPPSTTVTVTIAGATGGAAVSVGGLLIGALEPLGVTENSPSVGINDYSRKDTDDFGNTSFVERAWAKRMGLKSLIATDAVDVQVRRMASLRATPALWIGHDEFDSLMIYGFFRDFTVEVGETVSSCALTIEGLSTAGILGGVQVGWSDIIDDDPARPRPEDGATVGAPAGTPVGGRPAEDVVQDVDDTKASLVFQTARIDEILVDVDELLETYGSTASAAASAAAAEAAKLAAQGAETNANGYAGAAAASAASADASEAGAASSALVAAQWGNDARWAAQPNRGFDFGLDGWACFTSGAIVGSPPPIGDLPAGVVAATGYWGETGNGFLICPTTVSPTLVSRRMFPVDTSRKYRFRTRVGAYNTGSSGQNLVTYLGFIGLDKDGNYLDHGGFGSMRYCLIDPVIANVTWSVPDGQMRAATAIVTGEGNDTWQKFPPGTKNIRLICLLRYSGTGPAIIQYVDYLDFEDVTESQAANASASAAASSAASAGAQAALAQSSAILSAQIGGNSLTRNPTFADQDAAGGLGAWNTWTAPTSAARIVGSEGPYAHRMGSGPANAGYYQSVTLGPGDYIVEGAIALSAGARIEGAGIYLDPYAGGSGTGEGVYINFAKDTTVSGEMLANGSLFSSARIYRFSRLIRLKNPGTTYLNIYMMNNWTGFGETLYAKTLDWHRCSIRPASEGETLGAQVKTLAGAVATLQGKTGAYWQTEVNAGAGTTAFMQAKADSFSPQDAPLTFRTPTPQHIQVVGRDLRKTGGGSASWDVGVWSQEAYTAGAFVSFIPGQTTAHIMIGLNSDPQTSSDYNDIDYAMYCTADGTLLAYESGGGYDLGITYKVGDLLSVEYIGSTVFYKKNGKTIRAVATSAGRTFYLDSSFYTALALARSITFAPSGPTSFSSVAIGADEISLWNPAGAGSWKLAAKIAGGDATFFGNLNVGGGIYVGGLKIPVALQAFNISVYDGQVVSYGASLGTIPLLTPDFSGFPALPSGQSYVFRAESHTPTGFTARVKKATAATPTTSTTGAGTSPGTGPTFQANKAVANDAYDGNYSFRVTGTMYRQTDTVDIGDGGPVKTVYHGYIRFQSWFRPASGSWTEGPIIQVNAGAGTDGNQPYDKTFIANFGSAIGLDASNTEFGVSISSTYGVGINTLTGLTSVSHTYYSGATETTATPSNLPLLPVRVNPQNG